MVMPIDLPALVLFAAISFAAAVIRTLAPAAITAIASLHVSRLGVLPVETRARDGASSGETL